MRETIFVSGIFAVIAAFIAVINVIEPDTKNSSTVSADYCDMVSIFIETKGKYGYPDYKKSAKTECNLSAEQLEVLSSFQNKPTAKLIR